MSENWVSDIWKMHYKYEVHDWVDDKYEQNEYETLRKYLKFRLDFIEEELKETMTAYDEQDPEEVVDGLIDICVVAIGTLDALGVNAERAWDKVLKANMAKEVGVKPERPNPLGLPDLIKPEGWKAPSHKKNHGYLTNVLQRDF